MNSDDPSKHKKRRWPAQFRWAAIALALLGVVIWGYYFSTPNDQTMAPSPTAVPLSQLVSAVTAGEVKTLTVRGDILIATQMDGSQITAHKESHLGAFETLTVLGAPVEALSHLPLVVEDPNPGFNLTGAWCLLPLLGFMAFFSSATSGGSRARVALSSIWAI